MQTYISNIFMTGVMNELAMSRIENNLATPRLPSSVQAWIESSKHGEDEKSQNTINMHLACKKTMIKHWSSHVSHPGENIACAQPSVSHEEDEIQDSNFEYGSSQRPKKILKRMIGNQQQKELKRSQKMRLRVGLKMSQK